MKFPSSLILLPGNTFLISLEPSRVKKTNSLPLPAKQMRARRKPITASNGPANGFLPTQPSRVCLRIARSSLRLLPARDIGSLEPADVNAQGHLYTIDTILLELQPFSDNRAQWLIKIAHLMFDPHEAGTLYCHPTGSVEDWYFEPSTQLWITVSPADMLRSAVYEYRTTAPVSLAKICYRHVTSHVSTSSQNSATTLRNQVLDRDRTCVISHVSQDHLLVCSHLIPKRLGELSIQRIVNLYAGTSGVGIYHPSVAIAANRLLDAVIDRFDLGFYHITVCVCFW